MWVTDRANVVGRAGRVGAGGQRHGRIGAWARRGLGDDGGTGSRFAFHGGDRATAARGRLRNVRIASPGDAIRHVRSENHARPDEAAPARIVEGRGRVPSGTGSAAADAGARR